MVGVVAVVGPGPVGGAWSWFLSSRVRRGLGGWGPTDRRRGAQGSVGPRGAANEGAPGRVIP